MRESATDGMYGSPPQNQGEAGCSRRRRVRVAMLVDATSSDGQRGPPRATGLRCHSLMSGGLRFAVDHDLNCPVHPSCRVRTHRAMVESLAFLSRRVTVQWLICARMTRDVLLSGRMGARFARLERRPDRVAQSVVRGEPDDEVVDRSLRQRRPDAFRCLQNLSHGVGVAGG